MECSVLSFFRAECKVSETGSAQCWASSLICNLASVPDTNVAYSYLHENIKKSGYSCWEDPDLKWKEDFPDAKLLTNVKKNNL